MKENAAVRKTSIWHMVWADIYTAKKTITIMFVSVLSMIVFVFLLIGSAQYGNLHLLMEKQGTSTEAIMMLSFMCKYMPVCALGCMYMSVVENHVKIESKKWNRFRNTAPLSDYRWALAKIVEMLVLTVPGFLLSAGVLWIYSLVFGGQMTLGTVGIALICCFFSCFIGLILMIFGTLFEGSMDKAGLAMCCIMLPSVAAITLNINKIFGEETMKKVEEALKIKTTGDNLNVMELMPKAETSLETVEKLIGEKLILFSLVGIAVLSVVGYFVLGLIYQRREK